MADGAASPSADLEAFQRAFERRNQATRIRLKLLRRLELVTACEGRWQARIEAVQERIAPRKVAR